MEKEKVCCEMKAVETADGFRVEVKGKKKGTRTLLP